MSKPIETLTPPSPNGQEAPQPMTEAETRADQEAAIERRLERRLATRLADLRMRYAQGGQTRGSLRRQLDEIEAAMAQLEGAIAALEQVASGQN